jgi:hypothetical protein
MHLAIEVRHADNSHWERVETTDDNPYFPDALHRTYQAMIQSGAAESALMYGPEYRAIVVFQRSDSPSLTYFRYQEACDTYARYKKILGSSQIPGQRMGCDGVQP